MSEKLRLIYFNSRGAVEQIRFLLKYGGIEFEDVRINAEDWPKIKEKMPFGQLPLLEHEGKQINQTVAISRYCGKLVKLAGDNSWEDLEVDAAADTVRDFLRKLAPFHHEQDEERKKVIRENLKKETFPYYLSRFEKTVERGGHLALGRLTWVDFCFATVSDRFDVITGSDALADYPKLKELREKVNQLPGVKEWIEIRPKTDY